jgi:hypothetical protein
MHPIRRTGRILTRLMLPLLLIAGCGGPIPGSPDARGTQPSPLGSSPGVEWTSYSLYTHCGIDETNAGGRWYHAETPLSDGNGNPPAGWENPYQAGRLRVLAGGRVEFRDNAGHDVVFVLEPATGTPTKVCS